MHYLDLFKKIILLFFIIYAIWNSFKNKIFKIVLNNHIEIKNYIINTELKIKTTIKHGKIYNKTKNKIKQWIRRTI